MAGGCLFYLKSFFQLLNFDKDYYHINNFINLLSITNLYACIGVTSDEDGYLTNNSRDFHSHIGYKTVGVFGKCGRKFGRWYDMIWMEKLIGDHIEDPDPVKWYDHQA